MSVKSIDKRVLALIGLVSTWKGRIAELKAGETELKRQKSALRSKAIREGDEGAAQELEAVRSVVEFATTEIGDLLEEIGEAEKELAELAEARTAAVVSEKWDDFLLESAFAVKEAAELEVHLTEFAKRVGPHRDRVAKMALLLREAGATRSIDTRHLHRRIGSVFHKLSPFENSRQHKDYDKPYPELLQHIIDSIGRMRLPTEDEVKAS